MTKPKRIRLSRAKGWRLPDTAKNVARPSVFGNPFVVGRDGTREECVHLYAAMLGGLICLTSKVEVAKQEKLAAVVWENLDLLAGKDLACWCALDGKPCHADVLLALTNEPIKKGLLNRFLVT